MITLKHAEERENKGVMIGWQLSGFRRVAHYIMADREGSACGVRWMMSDAVTAGVAQPGDVKCKRCLRTGAGSC